METGVADGLAAHAIAITFLFFNMLLYCYFSSGRDTKFMKLQKILCNGLLITSLCLPMMANATPITSNAGLTGSTVVDFSQFVTGNEFQGVTGPIQIGGVVGLDISASSVTPDIYLYDNSWGLSDNGNWTVGGRTGYLGIWPGGGPVRIDFNDGPVAVVGFFMNYCPPTNPDAAISVFNSSGQLLEVFDVGNNAPISTPAGSNAGEFRGIQRDTAEIAYVQLAGTCSVYDDMEFTQQAQVQVQVSVPVNSTWALLLLSLVLTLTAGYGLRRQKIS